ncbi:MAG: cation:proton antiporter [Myxococcota bacterium]
MSEEEEKVEEQAENPSGESVDADGNDEAGATGNDGAGAAGNDAAGNDEAGAAGDDEAGAAGDDEAGAAGDDEAGGQGHGQGHGHESAESAESADGGESDDHGGHGGHGGHGHGEGHGGHGEGATLRQLAIVALLVGVVLLLHKFGDPQSTGRFDPTAMLALGFVILASFTIGHLVDVIKLPHITGYLIAGMVFGPSIAALFGEYAWAPFDRGVLNDAVIQQLNPLETLAVALIAITAGGELKLEGLKRGIRAISGILVVQLVAVLACFVGFFYLVSGAIPSLTLPGLEGIPAAAVVPVGLTLGAIGFATSPAATIAIINETGARGPMSRTVLSTVVLKDVFVVVLFGVFSALAIQGLGGVSEGNIATKLAGEIGFSILAGVLLGGLMGLYLRFVGQELMLFIAGVVYVGSFLSIQLHLDAVLVFLVAGFVVSNFSRDGETLIHAVDRLSMPVYVVFFTLAGAKLHLVEVWHLLGFAFALVFTRIIAIYFGVRAGGWLGGADAGTKRFGWMGFVSQAGVAITLAGLVKDRFGDAGLALNNLLIAGVALNEILGPVLLKVGLSLAGEIGDKKAKAPADDAPAEKQSDPTLEPWPEPVQKVDWGEATVRSSTFDKPLRELEHDLKQEVRQVAIGPMEAFEEDVEGYFRDLRREFLRQHRRFVVAARGASTEESEDAREEARTELARRLRGDQAELAERWRGVVLARSAQLGNKPPWTPEAIVVALDTHVDALPEVVEVPWDPRSFVPSEDDSLPRQLQRTWLRMRRGTRRLFGREMPPRVLGLRTLARYHLNFETPPRLEGVAALFVQAEQHVAGRTRMMFDSIVQGYDALADEAMDEVDLEAALASLREDAEEHFNLALDEVARIARDGVTRTARILSRGLRDVKEDASFYGTFDLPERARRSSRSLSARVSALEALTATLARLRKSSGGELALLAMELELVGLEAQVKDVLADGATRLERESERRAVLQAGRLEDALEEALQHVDDTLRAAVSTEQLAQGIRQITEVTEKVAGEAARIVRELREELLDEGKLVPLITALNDAASSLTARYEVSAGRMQRGEYKLPPAVERVEVPFREVVLGHVETRVTPQLIQAAKTMADKLQPLGAAMKEIERLVAFNVELATSELELVLDDDVPKDTRALLDEMIAGQLERSQEMIAGYRKQAEQWPAELGADLRNAVIGGVAELRGQLVDGKITRAKVDELRREASRRRLAQRANQLPVLLRQARRELGRAITSLVGEARLEIWRRALGLPIPKSVREADTHAFTAPKPEVELPLVYRRLFSAETMEAGDVLTGREDAITRARTILQQPKQRGRLRSVAFVGYDGVGKASVTAAVIRGGRWRKLARLSLDRPMSVEDVDALLKDTADAQLVVIEGAHWMLSARRGGFAPLRRFVDGVIADAGKRAWLLSAEQLFWDYARTIAPMTAAFPNMIELAPLSAEGLKAAVMERHRLSGYGHSFDRLDGGSRIEGLVARSASRIRRPFEQYFQDLHIATGGLLRDALRLWLASIRGVEGDEIVQVGHVPNSGFAAVSRLSDESLLVLFQIARQGWMDAPTLAEVFRISEGDARAQLAHFAHLGLLEEDEGVYRVSLHLRGTTARVIQRRGWM